MTGGANPAQGPSEAPKVDPTSQKERSGGTEYNTSTRINSVDELRTKEPELYKAIQEGMALQIIKEQRKHNRKMKEIYREGRRQ
ncbi:MAG: hypothetical protein K940chlam3_00677 [Chlamydiae bacterium]|nr:hypothetical protein [Chlamydiota bacterium]